MEIRHLRAFAALAQDLHFTRAAERLHLTQQALSKQISQLEAEFGTELLHRTTRKVELTPTGETLLDHALPILDAFDQAVVATRRAAKGDAAELRIAYTPTLGLETLPRLVARIHDRIPDVKLSTMVSWFEPALAGVLAGRFDFALARAPVAPPGIRAVTIRHEPLGVMLASDHALVDERPVPVAALANRTLILFPREHSPGYFDRVVEAFPDHYAENRFQMIENFSPEGFLGDPRSRTAIADGEAFQLAFEYHYDPAPTGFVWRPLDPPPLIRIDLIMRAGRLPAAQERVVDLALELAAERNWLARGGELAPITG